MTLEQRITADLRAGQATIKNLADNIDSQVEAVSIVLARMIKESKVIQDKNNSGMTVFRLNYKHTK